MCTKFEINRNTIDKFRKHAKIICFYLTSHDAKTGSDRYFHQEHFTTNQKSLRLLVKDDWLANNTIIRKLKYQGIQKLMICILYAFPNVRKIFLTSLRISPESLATRNGEKSISHGKPYKMHFL